MFITLGQGVNVSWSDCVERSPPPDLEKTPPMKRRCQRNTSEFSPARSPQLSSKLPRYSMMSASKEKEPMYGFSPPSAALFRHGDIVTGGPSQLPPRIRSRSSPGFGSSIK